MANAVLSNEGWSHHLDGAYDEDFANVSALENCIAFARPFPPR
jgi:hypothetical protein